MVPGVDAKKVLFVADPIEGFELDVDDFGNPLPPSCPYLVETREGIEVRRDPHTLVHQDPVLRRIYQRWISGVSRTLVHQDYDRLSHFELQCWETLSATDSRRRAAEPADPARDLVESFQTAQSLGLG